MNKHFLLLLLLLFLAGLTAGGAPPAAEDERIPLPGSSVSATPEEARTVRKARELRETDVEKAEAVLSRALSEKRTPVLLFELASLKVFMGGTEEAVKLFREAVRQEETFPEAYKNIGRLEAKLGHWEEAAEALRKGIRQGGPDGVSCSLLGQSCVVLGRYFRAEFPLRMALMGEPENSRLQFYLAQALYGQGRYTACEKAVQEALQSDPVDKKLWILLANARIAGNRPSEAIDAFEACLKLNSDVETGFLWTLGDLYVNEQLYDTAASVYNRALKTGAPRRQSLKNAVLAFHGAADIERARSYARLFLEKFGDQADVLLVLGELAMNEGNLEEAEKLCSRAVETDPLSGRAILLSAEIAYRQEEYEQALSWYASLEAVKGYREQALQGKVSILLETSRLEDALEVLGELNRSFPDKEWRELAYAVRKRIQEDG